MVGGNDMRDKKPELLVPAGGLIVANGDDANTADALRGMDYVRFGFSVYRRTGIWPQSESRQLFHRRDETGRGICPCT